MTKLRCPRCSTVIEVAPGQTPVCPNCGFGSAAPGTSAPSLIAPPAPAQQTPMFTPAPAPVPQYAMAPPYRTMPAQSAVGIQGKPRNFWVGLLLVIVTLGIYALVWNYKVFAELDRQHGREHEQVWFWLGFIPWLGFIFYWVYWTKEIRKLNEYRAMAQLPQGISALAFILWGTVGLLLLFLGPFIGYYQLQKSINHAWERIYVANGVPWPPK